MPKLAAMSLSGGMDSTSLLLHLLNKEYTVHALSFNYGQKHVLEIKKAQKNIAYLQTQGYEIEHTVLDISDALTILQSSLTTQDEEIPTGHFEQDNMKATVVPNRNAIFISFLYAFGLSLNKRYEDEITLSLGVHSGDHAIYPDCRIEFYNAIIEACKIGNWNSEHIHLYLPYIDMDKTTIIKEAYKLCADLTLDFNIIFANTLTSYAPDSQGKSDGTTGSDIERILAFDELGVSDPLEYTRPWPVILANAREVEKEHRR